MADSPYDIGWDRHGSFHEDRGQMLDRCPWLATEVPSICPVCFKDIEAREWCDRCGEDEEDVAA
jgi:hypothetical protein